MLPPLLPVLLVLGLCGHAVLQAFLSLIAAVPGHGKATQPGRTTMLLEPVQTLENTIKSNPAGLHGIHRKGFSIRYRLHFKVFEHLDSSIGCIVGHGAT